MSLSSHLFFNEHGALSIRMSKLTPERVALAATKKDNKFMGICFGVAHMGMQAVLSKDFDSFVRRFKWIDDLSVDPDLFYQQLEKINDERKAIITQVKHTITQLNTAEKEKQLEQIKAHPSAALQRSLSKLEKTIAELLEEKKLNETGAALELKRRKDSMVYNAFVQEKIEAAMSMLPQEKQEKFQIAVFIENIELYQEANLYPRFFTETDAPKKQEEINPVLPLLVSKKLEEQGGIRHLESIAFDGTYFREDLSNYFESLEVATNAAKTREPFTLVLSSRNANHTISVGYDPDSKEGKWVFIDADQLPPRRVNRDELLNLINESYFFKNQNAAIFTTNIFCSKSSESEISKLFSIWMDGEAWKKTHAVTPEKALYEAPNGYTWLCWAVQAGKLNLIKTLLENGAKPDSDLLSPLIMAIRYGNIEAIQLLSPKCSALATDYRFLLVALCLHEDLKIVATLLANGAKFDYDPGPSITPLMLAAGRLHNEDIVKALIQAGAEVNRSNQNGVTALFLAAQHGNQDILKTLLAANAKIDIAYKTPAKQLREFAKTEDVEAAMEAFLEKYLKDDYPGTDQRMIEMKPADIALVMGHQEIVSLLQADRLQNKLNPTEAKSADNDDIRLNKPPSPI